MAGEEETIKSNKEWFKKLGIFSQKIGMIPEDMVPKCKTKVQSDGDKFGLHNTRKNFSTINTLYKN